MERLFRSFKTEWLPSVGDRSAQDAHRDISHCLMHRYNWIRRISSTTDWRRPLRKKNLTQWPGLVGHYKGSWRDNMFVERVWPSAEYEARFT